MLNLEETLVINSSYSVQKDFYIRAVSYTLGVVIFIILLRAQVAEIDLLQLIPGFYLILLFISLVVLLAASDFFFAIPGNVDSKKDAGTKTETRLALIGIGKFSILLFVLFLCIALNNILPLSFDSFEVYEEKSLEDLWSFEEVLNLEVLLISIVVVLSQLPNVTIFYLTTERDGRILPQFWKDFSFLVFLISGLITPTIDGYTQLCFSFSAIWLYLTGLNILQKRIFFKFFGNLSSNF